MHEALLIDCETTGNEPLEVIELAVVEAQLTSRFVSLNSDGTTAPAIECGNVLTDRRFLPVKAPITLGAMATHHITVEDLQGCEPSENAVLPKCEYVIGHNVDYDWQALGSPNVKRICTLALARHLWPTIDCHKLSALAYHVFGCRAKPMVKNAHCALEDVILLVAVLNEMLPLMPQVKDWESLWQLSEVARVPTVMPFGKHKGMAIKDVPADYKRWLMGQPDVDPYLMMALQV